MSHSCVDGGSSRTSVSIHGLGYLLTALRRQGLIPDELVLQLATFLRSHDLFLELRVRTPQTLTANQVRQGDLFLHQQGLDTTTPAGKAMFQMLGVFAEFERSIIQERVRAGLQRAKREGKRLGRPPIADKLAERIRAALAGGMSVRKTAAKFDVNPSIVQRVAHPFEGADDLSTLAPVRVLRARPPDCAWARRAVGEGVMSCPRAGCGNLHVRIDERDVETESRLNH
jgi:Resolvase, N terminal domain